MGTSTSKPSKQEEPESKDVKNEESGSLDIKTPTDDELNEYKGDGDEKLEPVVEEQIVPTDGVQVRSFLGAPGVS